MPTLIGGIAAAIVVAAFFYALVRDVRKMEQQRLAQPPSPSAISLPNRTQRCPCRTGGRTCND